MIKTIDNLNMYTVAVYGATTYMLRHLTVQDACVVVYS